MIIFYHSLSSLTSNTLLLYERQILICRRQTSFKNQALAWFSGRGGTRFVSAQGAGIVKSAIYGIMIERQTQPGSQGNLLPSRVLRVRFAILQNKKPSFRLVFWQGGRDSNTQPAVLETAALPLSHPPKFYASKL